MQKNIAEDISVKCVLHVFKRKDLTVSQVFIYSIYCTLYCKTHSPNHRKSKKTNQSNNMTRPPAVCLFLLTFPVSLSHTRNPTAHICFFLSFFFCPWASKSCRHNPRKTFWIFLRKTDILPISSRPKN